LREGVDAIVAFLRANSGADDDAIERHLREQGLGVHAIKLIQFVPIAFTRFLYRSSGVQFAPFYVLLGPEGQAMAQRPIADEPAFGEAWRHCEEAAASGAADEYFIPIAARSGGYRAIQELVQKGSDLSGVITGPPVMSG
jgi:hypothetical protein